jgi:hypothetical protein
MSPPQPSLLLQFLRWVGQGPRTYGETMDAWRTSCPRLSVWEDATAEGLVEVGECAAGQSARPVTLTARGAAMLEQAS